MTSAYSFQRSSRGERVVFVDVRVGEAVEIEVHQREPHHVGRDVVALEVLGEAALARQA